MTNTAAAVIDTADEFAEVIADSPCMLFAAVTSAGEIWVYRSVLVEDRDDVYREVRERLAEGWTLEYEAEHEDDRMLFRWAVERRYRRAGHLDSAEAHDRSCSCGDYVGHRVEEIQAG